MLEQFLATIPEFLLVLSVFTVAIGTFLLLGYGFRTKGNMGTFGSIFASLATMFAVPFAVVLYTVWLVKLALRILE